MAARVIIVTSEIDVSGADRAAVFATTLSSHLADFSDVLFVDVSKDSLGLSYLGVPLSDEVNVAVNEDIWNDIRSNSEPTFMEGNDGDGPGGVVACLALSADVKRTGVVNTTADVVKLFRSAEENHDFIVVFAPQGFDYFFHSIVTFGQDFFHICNQNTRDQYDKIAYLMKTQVTHAAYLIPVFYGNAPLEGGWQKNGPSVTKMGMSWNDPTLKVNVDRLRSINKSSKPNSSVPVVDTGFAAALATATGSSVAPSVSASQTGATKRRWIIRPARAVRNGGGAFIALALVTNFVPSYEALVGDVSLAGMIASSVFAGVITSVRRKTVPAQPSNAVSGPTSAPVALPGGLDYQSVWDDIEARHKAVVDAWLEYELDVHLSLAYPTMLDHTVEVTAALHKALGSAEMLASTKDGSSNPLESPYGKAVQELELAYKVAEDYARKMGQSVWSASDRPKVETAEKLFAVALSDSASTNERQGAYKQALRNLEGVTAVPRKATQRIEAAIAMIEAAPAGVTLSKK